MTDQQYVLGGNVATPPPPYIPALAGRLPQSSRALGFFSFIAFILSGLALGVMLFGVFIVAAMHALSPAYGWTMLSAFIIFVSSLTVGLWNEQR